ncbi:MAG: serine/threonine-protein phosphatase [Bryobacterales bacterium]|nr:serine/threonine-protein phosphatase [Bryobacterales bacterium]
MIRFDTHAISCAGGRDTNQDALRYSVNGTAALWVLADGLGGHAGGEEASRAAVDAAMQGFLSKPECSSAALKAYLEAANAAVVARQEVNAAGHAMRTTVVLLVAREDQAQWAHVGDSRLYWFHQGRLAGQTLDHSVPQAMVDAGQLTRRQIRFHEDRNRLLRSLGGREALRATIEERPHTLAPGDAFLLCSDGFWDYVTETAMELDLAKSGSAEEWMYHMELRLRAALPEASDNYSAIAVMIASA